METSTLQVGNSAQILVRRIARFPLTRMVVAILAIGLAVAIANAALALAEADAWWARPVVTVIAVHAAYVLFVRWYERRAVVELDRWAAGRELILGFAGGLGLLTFVVAVAWAGGGYSVDAWQGWSALLPAIVAAAAVAYAEEVLFRGVVFRLVESTCGTWLGIAISALLFGLMHVGNPGATVLAAGAVALEAGVLLASVYVLTRRLWAPIGVHLGWNFGQGGVFGLRVSGTDASGLMDSSLEGPTWLTGGTFGIEASAVAVVCCTAVAALLLYVAYRGHRIVRPPWRAAQIDGTTTNAGVHPPGGVR